MVIDLDKKKSSGIKEDEAGAFSQYLWNKYQENKDYFKDAYSFIHNVLPGFYVHTTSGEGAILYIGDIWLRMKVKYLVERPSTGAMDSVVYTSIPFAATNEVFMSTRLNNSENALNKLAEEKEHTYLKTPTGLCTEVKLPLRGFHLFVLSFKINNYASTKGITETILLFSRPFLKQTVPSTNA